MPQDYRQPVTMEHSQGKALVFGGIAIFLLIILLIVHTCSGMSCISKDPAVNPAVSTSDTTQGSLTESPSDTNSESDTDYGIIPTDGSVELDRVQILNVYHKAEDVKNGNAIEDLSGITVYYKGKEVSGSDIPERYEFEDITIVWSKNIWVSEGITSVSFNIIPDFNSTDCKVSVKFPDGKIKTASDNIFTYPSSGTYRWVLKDPTPGIYTVTLTGSNLSTYYLDIISFT